MNTTLEALKKVPHAHRKAVLVTILVSVMGLFSVVIHRINGEIEWITALPLIIFYIVLCINTYFSVKLFSAIIPLDNIFQHCIDALLMLLYFMLAWFLNDRYLFIFSASLMFAAATIKYSSILDDKYLALFKKKIFTDNIGAFWTIIAYGGSIFIHPTHFVWAWSLSFVAANIYLLIFKPMYKI